MNSDKFTDVAKAKSPDLLIKAAAELRAAATRLTEKGLIAYERHSVDGRMCALGAFEPITTTDGKYPYAPFCFNAEDLAPVALELLALDIDPQTQWPAAIIAKWSNDIAVQNPKGTDIVADRMMEVAKKVEAIAATNL